MDYDDVSDATRDLIKGHEELIARAEAELLTAAPEERPAMERMLRKARKDLHYLKGCL